LYPSFIRLLATEAAEPPPTTSLQTSRPKPTSKPHISTAIVLNRSPILTRTPSLFEKAFYSYQQRIRRALHNPFPYEFYFKQGTLLETRFNLEERKREKLAFGPGFLEKEDTSEEKRAANIAAVEQLAQQEGEGEELIPRKHPADESGDVTSLDRAGTRNLYLLLQTVENGKEVWRFPEGDVEKGQFLHQVR
jgi:large subunit ribosomal protein L46